MSCASPSNCRKVIKVLRVVGFVGLRKWSEGDLPTSERDLTGFAGK